MSASNIDSLMELWNSSLFPGSPPFANHVDMYRTIDSTPLGDVRWQCFTMRYADDDIPEPRSNTPKWMTDTHEVWYRDVRTIVKHMLSNPDFNGKIDYAPLREFSAEGNRRLRNFMGGDWAWKQAVSLFKLWMAHKHGQTILMHSTRTFWHSGRKTRAPCSSQ